MVNHGIQNHLMDDKNHCIPTTSLLKFLQNHQIDKNRWNEIIRAAEDGRIYANTVWLDAMSPNWSALIKGDYEYIMPLTWKKKWGITYLAQPPFTQQLGIFSTNKISSETTTQFFEETKRRYRFGEIFSNYYHLNSNQPITVRKNYELDLSHNYTFIAHNYAKELIKRNLKQSNGSKLAYSAGKDEASAIHTFQALYGDRTPHVTNKHYLSFINLCQQLAKNNQVFIRNVHNVINNELLATSLFVKDEKRIYNISPSTFPNGRTQNANHFLLDELIKEFSGTGFILDFEGSDLQGVERFYKKFGSEMKPYYFYKWNNLPWPIKLLK